MVAFFHWIDKTNMAMAKTQGLKTASHKEMAVVMITNFTSYTQSISAVPNLYCVTDRFRTRQYIQGLAFTMWATNMT